MENKPEPDKTFEAENDRNIASGPKDHIPGWGIDADPENDPTYPMKDRNGADYQRFNYPKSVQQPVDMEVLQSIERPGISRVFGTSTPPEGVSGAIRRWAFQHNESTYLHWVPLVLADRIDAWRGIVDDLKQGIIPNIFAERGWKAEWKYNRKGVMQNVAIAAGIAVVVILLMKKKNKKM
jgi:hypothetical protein